jgi:hypothetical protein
MTSSAFEEGLGQKHEKAPLSIIGCAKRQAFPHRKRFKAILLDGIASREMLGSSNIGHVTWLRSILVDRASEGTSPHGASLGTVQMPMVLCVLLWERAALDRQQLGLKTAE